MPMIPGDQLRGRSKPHASDNAASYSSMLPAALRPQHSRDEELGKRDDDYVPHGGHHRKKSSSGSTWAPAMSAGPQKRFRRRRAVAIFVLVATAIYFFIKNMPTDLVPARERKDWRVPDPGKRRDGRAPWPDAKPVRGRPVAPQVAAPPRSENGNGRGAPAKSQAQQEHYYSGPIRFYDLRTTLDALMVTGGHRQNNRNVLFAAASLKSAANLLPMACEMASVDNAIVHFAVMGRAALPLADVLELNSIDPKGCGVYFHDARSDYSEYSSDLRAEAAVVGAMNHINTYMHPQVVITDSEDVENAFFTKGMRGKMKELERPVIELPAGKYDDFMWITRLDPSSLSSWHKPRLEILVQSPPSAGGGLVRLLKSLAEADLAGFPPPRLTIELPARIEGYLKAFLWEFRWPTTSRSSNLLRLHRRVSSTSLDTKASSVRFVESYYPSRSSDDHVLLLSANADVSPLFYHYTMYTLLATKYSAYDHFFGENLAGFALTLPTTALDGRTDISLPTMQQVQGGAKESFVTSLKSPPFLWQAPQAEAALIYGDRWAEFHDFISRRFDKIHKVGKTVTKAQKVIPYSQPAWLEFLLELTRARGWKYLYPASSDAGTFVTIHRELYQPPEEFSDLIAGLKSKTRRKQDPPARRDDPFLSSDLPADPPSSKENRAVSDSQPLHKLLPFQGALPSLSDLPLLTWDGRYTISGPARDAAEDYVKTFRREKGGCDATSAKAPKKNMLGRAGDLFCYDGKEGEEWDGSEVDYAMFLESKNEDVVDDMDHMEDAPQRKDPPAAARVKTVAVEAADGVKKLGGKAGLLQAETQEAAAPAKVVADVEDPAQAVDGDTN